MSKKLERDYVKHIAECGLSLISATKTNGNRLRLMVLAPNGNSRPFFFSEHGGDWRAVRNNLAELERFAAENPRPVVGQSFAKALAQMGTALGDVRESVLTLRASERPAFKLQPYQQEVIAAIEKRIELPLVDCGECRTQGCRGTCRKARDEPAAPIPSPAPTSAPVAPSAAPAAPIESKPTMTTATIPTTSTTPVIQRLDRKQFHALTKWVAGNVQQGHAITLATLSREASKALDFHVSESSLKDALDLEEIKLAEPHSRKAGGQRDRAQIVAGELVRVMQSLGVEPSAELAAIAERRGQQ